MILSTLLSLFIASTLYAVFLNWKPVNEWYTPNWTWLTVVGGNSLIGIAILALCLGGELPIKAFWLVFGANIAAGVPIIVWQLWRWWKRRKQREERKRRP